jgi:hypothetical protein
MNNKRHLTEIVLFTIFQLGFIQAQVAGESRFLADTNLTKTQKVEIIHSSLALIPDETTIVRKNDSVVEELYLTVIDTANLLKTRSILDSFLQKRYDQKQLISSLALLREFGPAMDIRFAKSKPQEGLPSFDNATDAKKYIDSIRKAMLGRLKVKGVNMDQEVKDTLRIPEN